MAEREDEGIKGFVETSFVDWPGRICAVIFLGGCNFRCPYCHNPDLVLRPHTLEEVSLDTVLEGLEWRRGWVDGVCVTGGEPTVNPHLPRILGKIRKKGWEIKLDTNGSRPEVLRYLAQEGLIQAVSMDLKAPLRPQIYSKMTGVNAPIDKIAESVFFLRQSFLDVEFRTTLVPGLLGKEDLAEMVRLLCPNSRYVLQSFRPGKTLHPAFEDIPPYPKEVVVELEEVVRKELGRGLTPDNQRGKISSLRLLQS